MRYEKKECSRGRRSKTFLVFISKSCQKLICLLQLFKSTAPSNVIKYNYFLKLTDFLHTWAMCFELPSTNINSIIKRIFSCQNRDSETFSLLLIPDLAHFSHGKIRRKGNFEYKINWVGDNMLRHGFDICSNIYIILILNKYRGVCLFAILDLKTNKLLWGKILWCRHW